LKKKTGVEVAGYWFFHHDNAPAHTAFSVTTSMARNGGCFPLIPLIHPMWLLVIFDSTTEEEPQRKEFHRHGGEKETTKAGAVTREDGFKK